nr:TPA_asm: hypothetical protein [Megastigmus wasp adintovirus]
MKKLFYIKLVKIYFRSEVEKSQTIKHVNFQEKVTIHKMYTWTYANRCARRGEWEQVARDRERFKLRIKRIEKILDPILLKKIKNM